MIRTLLLLLLVVGGMYGAGVWTEVGSDGRGAGTGPRARRRLAARGLVEAGRIGEGGRGAGRRLRGAARPWTGAGDGYGRGGWDRVVVTRLSWLTCMTGAAMREEPVPRPRRVTWEPCERRPMMWWDRSCEGGDVPREDALSAASFTTRSSAHPSHHIPLFA